ncbi:DUF779 domain-containing protein [Nocardioides sp. BP30]|uniref:DUF779 domain-containing protein n=1 Tax=Nocardioides sp. BP30 TaxID=3036374 RepID=UPI002468E328|nr:DUF779 domain-containing protein [Nocardioides sp. BP30]WGL50569.1 DUF779 domain-containing protein [Nocardioides sp. BP30]
MADHEQRAVTATPVSRVAVTAAAAGMIRALEQQHGPVMFHQSGGCCDGSAPMCFPEGEFLVGDADVHVGDLDVAAPDAEGDSPAPVQVWMSREQFAYWSHTHLTIDLVPGRGAGFSLEAPTGYRFLLRSRLLTDEEAALLGPPG